MEKLNYKRRHRDVLEELINKHNSQKIAEVGVWKGHLFRNLLNSSCKDIIKEYWAIDQWKVLDKRHGRMAKRTERDWYNIYWGCCQYMQFFPQLRIVKMSSKDASKLFRQSDYPEGYFDLVFIDASHFYKDVLKDINYWHRLVKKGGIISGHDYGTGASKGHTVKPAVDEFFGEGNFTVLEDGVWYKIV